ncbi:MAG: reverse transcriptase domain-containing protein, partial [Steroidobacter sp.]
MVQFEKIATTNDLAAAMGLSKTQIVYWAFLAPNDQLYTEFDIQKRAGGIRRIKAPLPPLKEIQRRLAVLLSDMYEPRHSVHGFVRARNILTNAMPHASRRFVLNVDIKDFFPSINFGRVRGALLAPPFRFPSEVATLISRLACHNNELPQGAPTSPVLANVVCMRLDSELLRLAKSFGLRYTRYADDITFSTRKTSFPESIASAFNPPYGTQAKIGDALDKVITSNGFSINDKKTRLLSRQASQRVTGLVVNRFPNVSRKYVRRIRAMIHAWEKYGLEKAEVEWRSRYAKKHRAPYRDPVGFKRCLKGMLSYLSMIKGQADPLYVRLAKRCRSLDKTMFPIVLDNEELVDRAVWVVESGNSQGTGFFLGGVGFVTCAHVIDDNEKIDVFHPQNIYERHAATLKYKNTHLDLAILNIHISNVKELALGDPTQL